MAVEGDDLPAVESNEEEEEVLSQAGSDEALSDNEDGESGDEDDDASDDDDDGGSELASELDDESILTTSTAGYIDHYDEDNLPPYGCRYCGIHDPASVARCVDSGKWFCNATCTGGGGSHLVHHLVRSRNNQVQLHPESPLGDTVLECYNCASKDAFVLGFVPASSSSVVVLLCRVCVETVPALKDMDWELSQWHPLVQDRKFLPWLVKVRSCRIGLHCIDDIDFEVLVFCCTAIWPLLMTLNLLTDRILHLHLRYHPTNSKSVLETSQQTKSTNLKNYGNQNPKLASPISIAPMPLTKRNSPPHYSTTRMDTIIKMCWLPW